MLQMCEGWVGGGGEVSSGSCPLSYKRLQNYFDFGAISLLNLDVSPLNISRGG